jgi:hypothetical protein
MSWSSALSPSWRRNLAGRVMVPRSVMVSVVVFIAAQLQIFCNTGSQDQDGLLPPSTVRTYIQICRFP